MNQTVVPFGLQVSYLPGGVPARLTTRRPDLSGRTITEQAHQLRAFCGPRNTRGNWFNVQVAF